MAHTWQAAKELGELFGEHPMVRGWERQVIIWRAGKLVLPKFGLNKF